MTKINHPFLINLRFAFQTNNNVYLIMPYVAGGELFHHLSKEGLLLEVGHDFQRVVVIDALIELLI
jgi:serine/threonine protein kinase